MKIKDLLVDESKWTQCAFARDKDGQPVRDTSLEAISFCIVGAVEKVYGSGKEAERVKNRLKAAVGFPMDWNDSPLRNFTEVRKLIEELDI